MSSLHLAPSTEPSDRPVLRIVMVGHVDHGKSTLVGRLLHETNSLPDGKVEAVAAMSKRRGMPFEWAFVTDALQAERDQGITIDASHIRLRHGERQYVLVDAPGHKEFLRNMITGAATSDAALLVIDAAEGVCEQSRRHGFLLDFLGITQVVVAVNKMDLVGFDADRFAAIRAEFTAYLASLGIHDAVMVPIAARHGDNVAERSTAMPWYDGPTVLDAMTSFSLPRSSQDLPLRLSVQDVYKFDERRILAGTIQSGRLHVGDRLLFSPANKVATIASIEAWGAAQAPLTAHAGQAIGITLDQQLFLERGDVASHEHQPPLESDVFRARLFWLGHDPVQEGDSFVMKHLSAEIPVTVQKIERVLDPTNLATSEPESGAVVLARDGIIEVILRARRVLALDPYQENRASGRFVLVKDCIAVAGGLIDMRDYPDQRHTVTVKATNVFAITPRITNAMREERNGHRGAVLWMTGLSGAGKSTLAIELERELFRRGQQVYILDGDTLRTGLNADLGFSPEDRAENIRRIGASAALFADAGFIVICAAISPYRSDRRRARQAAGDRFHEIWVKADLSTCEQRDPKGLYRKARAGQIKDFTGISAPYEPPEVPDMIIDTTRHSVEECLQQMLDYIGERLRRR